MVKNKHNLENNPYSERLGFVQQFSAYGDLDDTNKSTIAHLAFDQGLKHAAFYEIAREIIYKQRAMGGYCPQCVFCGAIRWTPSIV